MSDFECPHCGTTEEPREELTGTYCVSCDSRVDGTSEEIIEEVKENHEYLGE